MMHWLSPLIHISFTVAMIMLVVSVSLAAAATSAHDLRAWLQRGAIALVFGLILLSTRLL